MSVLSSADSFIAKWCKFISNKDNKLLVKSQIQPLFKVLINKIFFSAFKQLSLHKIRQCKPEV